MLVLVVGGSFQGKSDFAKSFGMPVMDNLHQKVREMMEESKINLNRAIHQANDMVYDKILNIARKHSGVIVCDEIGCGIIPAEKFERDYREITGRILCEIAKMADEVYKVEAGIAMKIKG